jgi:hypothetical protein
VRVHESIVCRTMSMERSTRKWWAEIELSSQARADLLLCEGLDSVQSRRGRLDDLIVESGGSGWSLRAGAGRGVGLLRERRVKERGD